MAQVIELAEKMTDKTFDSEPCTNCEKTKKARCSEKIRLGKGDTCEQSKIWWDLFAKQFRRNKRCSD